MNERRIGTGRAMAISLAAMAALALADMGRPNYTEAKRSTHAHPFARRHGRKLKGWQKGRKR